MRTRQVEAVDRHGTPRTYGIGRDLNEAIQECHLAAESYLMQRADITALFLRDADNQKPIIEAATKRQWCVK